MAVTLPGSTLRERPIAGILTVTMCYRVGALLVLILDIYVIYLILKSREDAGQKLLWIILVVLLPLVGPILYFLLGPGRRRT